MAWVLLLPSIEGRVLLVTEYRRWTQVHRQSTRLISLIHWELFNEIRLEISILLIYQIRPHRPICIHNLIWSEQLNPPHIMLLVLILLTHILSVSISLNLMSLVILFSLHDNQRLFLFPKSINLRNLLFLVWEELDSRSNGLSVCVNVFDFHFFNIDLLSCCQS